MLTKNRIKNICCIGAGYVGGPTSAVIAQHNRHISVTVVDLDESRIAAWNSSDLPIYEPGLTEVVQDARDGIDGRAPNLYFSSDICQSIADADMIFIAVGTPTKIAGEGAGYAPDLAFVESAARHIAKVATSYKIIVEKSTVPCGTACRLREILDSLTSKNVRYDILSNPEFLAEGSAIQNLLHPDRVLIGSLNDESSVIAAESLVDVYATWVPRERIVTINLWSSELAKLATNCMLAQRISSINSLSAICEATGADIDELSYAIGLDRRIGNQMLKASAGFGGSCFKKDVLSLVYIAQSLNLPEVAAYWRSVVDINEYQKNRCSRRITRMLNNTLTGKKISVLGFAYKKNTGDTRESAAVTVIGNLITEGAHIAVFDPQVSEQQIYRALEESHPAKKVHESVSVHDDALSACANASAVVILTAWDHFKTNQFVGPLLSPISKDPKQRGCVANACSVRSSLDISLSYNMHLVGTNQEGKYRVNWSQIAVCMGQPRLIFDGCNIVEPEKLAALGFQVECIGQRGAGSKPWKIPQ